MATDDRSDAFSIEPTNEGTNTAVLIRDSLDWLSRISTTQAPEKPTIPAAMPDVIRIYTLLVNDTPTAQDAVKDALTSGWDQKLSYLRQTVLNTWRSVLRHRKVVDAGAAYERSAVQATPALIERSAVIAALRTLPQRQREAIVLRYYADLSDADIAPIMGISRAQVKGNMARGMAALNEILYPADKAKQSMTVALPISIYLADEDIHAQVEAAVEEWLTKANISIEEREQPIIGSWFRQMRATAKAALNSETAQDVAMTAVHAADARLILAQDASITATLLSNLGPVIHSLQPTKDAVLRVGALLIVKVDWAVQVIQLTAAQQAILDHQPQLASAPHQVIAALQLPTPAPEHATSAAELRRP